MARTAVFFGLCLMLGHPAASVGAQEGDGSAALALIDVPYVSQGVLLCGGAAAAMLVRHTGARGIYAEDFASLVDEAAGGIRTTDLAAALRARGYRVRTASGEAADVRDRLTRGQPVMTLIEDRPGRFHYVVLVGWHKGAVVYHDPARAPFIAKPEQEFERAWEASGRWMLVLEGAPGSESAVAGREAAPSDISAVENTRANAREPAMRLFLEEQYGDSAKAAEAAIAADPNDLRAWRLLGAARYLDGQSGRALDAWNHSGEPRVDLVRLEGLFRTPHRTAERLAGVRPGGVLTRQTLTRADRRLSLLPAQQGSRVSYVALPGGLAEVRGALVERPLWPSRLQWVVEAARLPIDREIKMSTANMVSGGERFDLAWRFWEGRQRAALDLHAPLAGTPGVWSLEGSWQQETYTGPHVAPESRRRLARLGWTDWVSGRLRVSAGGGLAHWDRHGRAALLDGSVELRPLRDRLALGAALSGGVGGLEFASVSAGARWRQDLAERARLLGTAGFSRVTRATPIDLWPGAGTGQGRAELLRAHPLLDAGAIAGDVFGRAVAHGGLEAQRDVHTRGLLTLGVAVFADTAQAWQRSDGSRSALHVDAGAGLRIRIAPGHPVIRIDVARGLQDGQIAVSAGWQGAWPRGRGR